MAPLARVMRTGLSAPYDAHHLTLRGSTRGLCGAGALVEPKKNNARPVMICAQCAATEVRLVGWRLARSEEVRSLPVTSRQLSLFGARPVFLVRAA